MTDGRTILITGSTDGLGLALAHHLAADGAQLILHGRHRDKLDRTAADIAQRHHRPEPATVLADLADLAQVRDLSKQVASRTDHVDVLVNNAGIGSGEPDGRDRRVSADGYELRFAVNYLAGLDLTLRLLPLLHAAGAARIVNVASIGQHPIDFSDVMLEHHYSGTRAYGQSKLAQITAGFVLAERLPAATITVNSLHPATYMPTKMVLDEIGHSIDTIEEGEAATRRLVSTPEVATVTGRFFDRTRDVRANAAAYDPETRRRLWQLSLDLTGAPDAS
ncbi:MAG: 3-oxoacyl-ACP reductase [Solirubrobacterales bacterium]|nr:3-oxoacyl-ACP reductase [Solirubrobacterales bacterium]